LNVISLREFVHDGRKQLPYDMPVVTVSGSRASAPSSVSAATASSAAPWSPTSGSAGAFPDGLSFCQIARSNFARARIAVSWPRISALAFGAAASPRVAAASVES
jgi:hypothetical protein